MMPRGDRTGPAGMGPMTGRGAGYCAGLRTPGFMKSGFGRPFGLGRRRGFGQMAWLIGLGCGYFAYQLLKRGGDRRQ